MDLDLTESIAPRSDQINADDLIAGPITYTIREVIKGKAESPFDFLLVETDRAYRPSKTMRKVIVAGWKSKTSAYVGRRLTVYREPKIEFAGKRVGGIRISAMSDLPGGKPLELSVQVKRGVREELTIQPLADAPPNPNAETERAIAALLAEYPNAEPDRQLAIRAEVETLRGGS